LARRIGQGAHSLAGQTDLLELAAILENACIVVTTDSGPMHMAAATGVPVVALFGPGDPKRYCPRGQPGQTIILQGRSAPRDPLRWHSDLTATQVIDAILAALGRHSETRGGDD
jgi:ADP-heptose:LPS heptosyltransferase